MVQIEPSRDSPGFNPDSTPCTTCSPPWATHVLADCPLVCGDVPGRPHLYMQPLFDYYTRIALRARREPPKICSRDDLLALCDTPEYADFVGRACDPSMGLSTPHLMQLRKTLGHGEVGDKLLHLRCIKFSLSPSCLTYAQIHHAVDDAPLEAIMEELNSFTYAANPTPNIQEPPHGAAQLWYRWHSWWCWCWYWHRYRSARMQFAQEATHKIEGPHFQVCLCQTTGQWVGSKQQQHSVASLATKLSSLPASITEDITLMVNFLKGELENQRKVTPEMSLVELYHHCKLACSTRDFFVSFLEHKYRSVKSKHMPFTMLFYGRNITNKKERKAVMHKVQDLDLYGKRLVQMANAGSFYFLILLAVKGLTTLRGMSESEVVKAPLLLKQSFIGIARGVASTVWCDNLINSDLYFGSMPIEVPSWPWKLPESKGILQSSATTLLEANFDNVKSSVRNTRSPYVHLPDSDKPTLVWCSDKSILAFKTQAPKMMADTFEGSIDFTMSKSELNKFSHQK
ncbi:hypothetical protein EV122DRAFT_256783, partial [Schizophyllum commune]